MIEEAQQQPIPTTTSRQQKNKKVVEKIDEEEMPSLKRSKYSHVANDNNIDSSNSSSERDSEEAIMTSRTKTTKHKSSSSTSIGSRSEATIDTPLSPELKLKQHNATTNEKAALERMKKYYSEVIDKHELLVVNVKIKFD